MRRRCAFVAILVLLSAWLPASPALADKVWFSDDEVSVSGEAGAHEAEGRSAAVPPNPLVEFVRSARCLYPPASSLPCPQVDPAEPPLSLRCDEGAPVAPLWRRERESTDVEFVRDWVLYAGWSCPRGALPAFTQADLRVMKIEPLVVRQQPVEGPMLLNKPVIVYVEPEERDLRAVLLGTYGVDVHVKPLKYTWDFGDGEKLTTRRAGRPYPAFDVTHMYAETGTRQITLTTTWTATYRLDDDPAHRWRDVPGTATTTDTGIEFEIIEWRTRLVDE